MSNYTPENLRTYFQAAGITDPEDVAYLLRNPDVAAQVQHLGANTAKLHYQVAGQKEGRPWGLTASPAAAPADPAAEAAKKAPPALPASYGASNSADAWRAFMNQSRLATEGINRMPGVFSGYDKIPSDTGMINELFYPAAQQAQVQGGLQNALLMGLTPGQTQQSQEQANALLGGGPGRYEAPSMEQRIKAQYGQ